jgi:hypothetical protein
MVSDFYKLFGKILNEMELHAKPHLIYSIDKIALQ